ncbi:MAG: 23S rRNA (adenine(2503)-C(2))-methyltransferase RlmN [Ruminococcaceae bacterium]|nr:23S rRNA (adenine(2503)-C(2))-methyltransferase RlmN [Oscillospiraceae bacterium]
MNSIYSYYPDELKELMASIGEPKYRADQIFTQLHKGILLDEMTNVGKKTKEKIKEITDTDLPSVNKKLISKIDGTVKYLFELSDKNCIEAVVMQYEHGYTLCISSQVGCRMGCKFCASTIAGRVRDLEAGEMLGQIIAANRDLGIRISNVVMMGIGEPLDNFDNTVRFLRLVNMEGGVNIGYRHISLSTCGVVPKIYALSELDLPITLSISLHAPDDETRSQIMPVNNKWGVSELLSACKDYYKKTGRRISFEYTLISGKNDSKKLAEQLASVLNSSLRSRDEGMPIHVNLIPVNEVGETGFKPADKKGISEFARTLESKGIRATVRRKLGSDINASCGQLRRENMQD